MFLVFVAGPRGVARREVQGVLGVSAHAVLYHLRRLKGLGLIAMFPNRPRSPGTIYVARCYLDGSECVGGLFSARGLAKALKVSVRVAERFLNDLYGRGLVIPLAGASCRYKTYLWVGRAMNNNNINVHRHVSARHSFRSNGLLGWLRRLVKSFCDAGNIWDWDVFRDYVLGHGDIDPRAAGFFLP